MRIHGLVVSVDYADLLAKSIALWRAGLESLTVVTAPHDKDTQILAGDYRCQIHVTDAFYRNGAHFNKGAAQQEAWAMVPKDGWLLLIDADVIPQPDWRSHLELCPLQPGYLYGCWRYDERGVKIGDDTHGYGYFQLFHATDHLSHREPFFDTWWTHGGNADSFIMLRWRDEGRLAPPLPLKVTHPGGKSENWFGRGRKDLFDAMQAERRRRGGGWKSIDGERIQS